MAIRTGIIGYGMSAKTFHLPFLLNMHEYSLRGISTRKKEILSEEHPAVMCYDGPEKLINDVDIDLVIITSPNESHYPLAKRALEAGKHVVVEKPFTITYRESLKLLKTAAKQGKILTVFHNRRWDGDILTIKELLEQGKFGNLSHVESHYDRFRPNVRDRWREKDVPGSGLLYDLGSHLIDQMIHLFGSPLWVQADVARQRDGAETDDFVHILLGYRKFRAELHISVLVNAPVPRFAIHGDTGSYIKYHLDPQEDQLKAGKNHTDTGFGGEEDDHFGTYYPAPEGSTPMVIPTARGRYQDFYSTLASAIQGSSEPPVDAGEAAEVIKVIELARKSSTRGKRLYVK